MRKLKLLLSGFALLGGVFSAHAQISWTDKTSLITNPSFETDDAIANLTSCGWATDRVTGWTITPSSASNAQIGVGNSSSTIQGIGSTFNPSEGEKYFYTRNNWNANTTFTLSQTISAGSLQAGLYKLTCKTATYSDNAAFNTLTLSLKEGTNSPVANSGIVMNVWNTWGVILFKQADDTDLTITITFKPGYDGNGKHYAVVLDDFHLEFISTADAYSASESNTIDFSAFINNAGIYNHSTKDKCPRGWTASKHTTGNGNYTEGEKCDTRLEGWSGGNLDIDYNQTISNLPVGSYTVTAAAQENAKVGRTYVYASTEGQNEATGLVNNSPEYDVTTSALKVTNGNMKIGIKSTANDWVTADNFRISFLGFDVDAVKATYETAYLAATTARDADENANIVGTERTTFVGVITTYTTDVTQSYGWYVAAKNALEAATSDFTAAKPSYDALVAEIANAKTLGVATATADSYAATSTSTAASALANVQALNVEEYNAITTKYDTDGSALFIPSWDKTNFDSRSDQHWSGTTREYFDKWSGSSFNSSISKTVTLPEGHYAFYAAGRGQANSPSAVTLKVAISGGSTLTQSYTMKGDTGKGIDNSGAANFGEGSFANNGAGRGWEWRYIAFDLDAETSVTLSIEGSGNSSWIGACDTKLLTYNNVEVSRRLYNTNKEAAIEARDNSDYDNIIGTERTALVNAIDASVTETFAGYNTAAENLATATAAFIEPSVKTNYDALVREIAKAKALGIADATADSYAATPSSTSASVLANTQALKVAEYNYVSTFYAYGVELGTWTTTGPTGSLSSQHWSGETREYLEQSSAAWNTNSWTIKYAQNVTLPQGNYIFKVAGRQADSNGVTLSLVVKKGNDVLGSVSDFPHGDSGLGITTAGATSFDPNDTFCNTRNNNGDNLKTNGGNGWEWRYVQFTLDEDATVNVAVDAVATLEHMWVSFCDATVQTDNAANVSLITYNIALNNATTARDNAAYENVGGTEKAALLEAIAADEGLDKTDASEIDAAKDALVNATAAFIAAKEGYDAWVAVKDVEYTDDKPYASSTKFAAIATAQEATPTTAAAAATAANAVLSAYRKYIESNALAEGVAGAEQITVEEYRFAGMTADDIHKDDWKIGTKWTLDGQNNGTISLTNSGSFTDGDGNADYNYVHIQKNDNNAGIHQTINLEPGQYIMTVTARCQSGQGAKFEAFAGGVYVNIPQNDNTGGQFDRGWNDVSVVFNVLNKGDINFGVKSDNGKNIWWSATRFRLVRLGNVQVTIDEDVDYTVAAGTADVTLKRTLKADTWNTFVVPFAISNAELKAIYGNEVEVAEYSEVADGANSTIYFNKMATPEISANKPVLLKPKDGGSLYVFVDRTITSGEAKVAGTNFEFVGTYASTTIAEGDYFIGSNKLWKSEGSTTIAGTRAYIKAVSADARIGEFSIGENETTGISTLVAQPNANTVYDMQGRRVETMKKGIYVVNGKKVVIK